MKQTWQAILEHNGHDSTLHDYDLVRQWYESFNTQDTPLFLSLWEGDFCVAIYPMLVERKAGSVILKNLWVDTFSIAFPLVRKEYRDVFMERFMTALDHGNVPWDALKLSAVPTYMCHELNLAPDAFTRLGHQNMVIADTTWCIDLRQPFEEYLKTQLSMHSRRSYRNRRNKLERENARFVIYKGREALPHWETLLHIEDNGWKAEQGSSILRTPPIKGYCDVLVRTLAEQDKLYFCFLELQGKAIAGSFSYYENGVLNGLKGGYLREYKGYSPFHILTLSMVEHFREYEPRAALFNIFPNTYGYKDKFSHGRESFLTFTVAGKSLKSRLLMGLYKLKMRHLSRRQG